MDQDNVVSMTYELLKVMDKKLNALNIQLSRIESRVNAVEQQLIGMRTQAISTDNSVTDIYNELGHIQQRLELRD